ncbi:MAG TPA: hypothetical protein VIU87_07855 [Mycobacterium sp.]
MTVYEILTVMVAIGVGTVATVAIYLGLLNWIGVFHIVRCSTCHHLTASSVNRPQPSCPHCRHPALTHPLYAAHHRGAPVRVRVDPLKY